ncbi:MAG: hypothetical protein ACYCQI_16870 [Gammaproteobacteria bacterium]
MRCRNRFFSFFIWITPGCIAALIFYLITTIFHQSDKLLAIAQILFIGSIFLGVMGFLYSYRFFTIKNSTRWLIRIYLLNVFGAYVIFYFATFYSYILSWFSHYSLSGAITTLIWYFLFGIVFFLPLIMVAGIPAILILYIKNKRINSR